MDEVLAYEQSAGSGRVPTGRAAFARRFSRPSCRARLGNTSATLEHFSPAQIVELAFKFLYWSSNRPIVTLGIDAPHDEHRLTSFHYGDNGEYIVHARD